MQNQGDGRHEIVSREKKYCFTKIACVIFINIKIIMNFAATLNNLGGM